MRTTRTKQMTWKWMTTTKRREKKPIVIKARAN